ncbi:methyltransferase domain-containing protein [Uliginosibacterium sp. 31-16]|uniref:methyltransferase domain-containing protein n=1 Tax=Uliginosibacterium sp. 31-16 TaxID=3068315 RepID=UPI00273DB34F|nr:methyltransferase domain-containing protein [Uliginosibacterium sp. 31-16]MDP5239452.1 methyltransferase domain-containing protein [Uliginosibacterium sp. 31-16]
MPGKIEKQAIRAAFGRAATRYDTVAEVQRRIARILVERTPVLCAGNILDAGCGTGFGATHLRRQAAAGRIFTLDAAHAMCVQSANPLTVCGDIEALPLANSSMDLYWSSLAWQWTRPVLAIAEAARILKPGGLLRVATLGPETLHELRCAFSSVDEHPHVRDFDAPELYAELLASHGFRAITLERSREQTFSSDLAALLRDIRTLGAHELGRSRRPGLLGRRAWMRLLSTYESFREAAGLPVSYDVIMLSATRIS